MKIREKVSILIIIIINLSSFCTSPFLATMFLPDKTHEDFVDFNNFSHPTTLFIQIASGVIGIMVPRIASKKSYLIAVAISRTATILYGFIIYMKVGSIFHQIAATLRFIESSAGSAYFIIGCGIMFNNFPEIRGLIRGLFENSITVFIALKPVVSSEKFCKNKCFNEDQFWVPFLIVGGIILALAALETYFLEEIVDKQKNSKTTLKIFLVPKALILLFIVSTISITMSGLYGAQAEFFGEDSPNSLLSSQYLQIYFTVVFLIFSLFWGLYSMTLQNVEMAIPLGLILTGMSLVCLEPTEISSKINSIYFVIFIVFVLGITIPICQTPTFRCLNATVLENGFEDNLETKSSLVASWSLMSRAGVIVDNFIYYDANKTVLVILVISVNILMAVIFGLFVFWKTSKFSAVTSFNNNLYNNKIDV